ncbi:MAG: helix-turn-helix domain-containing protein [Halodesulfurarchaeum sp.]
MSATSDQYRLTFRLRYEDCPGHQVAGTIEDVAGMERDDGRVCEFIVETDEGISISRYTRSAGESCPCRAVAGTGALPRVRPSPDGEGLELTTYVAGPEDAQSVASALEAEHQGIELMEYECLGPGDRNWRVEVDLGSMTAKRREALLAAMEAGYYENPRETTIEELAADLDISGSAFGTRLRKAEAGLVDQLRDSL